jgi:hypothetical protein
MVLMSQHTPASPPTYPGEAIRVAWFFVVLFGPSSGIAYVTMYGLEHGGREALLNLSLILSVSLFVSILAAITMPLPGIASLDSDMFARPARGSLCLALLLTICFALLLHDPSSQSCPDVACRSYPLASLAFAGMYYCYSISSYILRLRIP